jgi:uncharacterized protein YbjT (DUF2867 family)
MYAYSLASDGEHQMQTRPDSGGGRTALVLGSTGLVGGHTLGLLLADPNYRRVTAPVRRPLPVKHEKLVQLMLDFDHLADQADAFRVDDIFCCLGTTIKTAGSQEAFRKVDFTYPVEAARIGAANGAHRFLLVSSLGANPQSSVFYSRVKGETEEAVGQLPFRLVAIFRPSMLMGKRKEFRLGEVLITPVMRGLSFGMVGRWRRFRPIEAEVVACAMVAVASMDLSGRQVFESENIQGVGARSPDR